MHARARAHTHSHVHVPMYHTVWSERLESNASKSLLRSWRPRWLGFYTACRQVAAAQRLSQSLWCRCLKITDNPCWGLLRRDCGRPGPEGLRGTRRKHSGPCPSTPWPRHWHVSIRLGVQQPVPSRNRDASDFIIIVSGWEHNYCLPSPAGPVAFQQRRRTASVRVCGFEIPQARPGSHGHTVLPPRSAGHLHWSCSGPARGKRMVSESCTCLNAEQSTVVAGWDIFWMPKRFWTLNCRRWLKMKCQYQQQLSSISNAYRYKGPGQLQSEVGALEELSNENNCM